MDEVMNDHRLDHQIKDDAEIEEEEEEEVEEESERASSDSDTSAWDSDPATHKTKKQYYPVLGGEKDSNSLGRGALGRESSHESSDFLEEGALKVNPQNEEEEHEEKDSDSKDDDEDGDDEDEEENTAVKNNKGTWSGIKSDANGAGIAYGQGERKYKAYRLGDEKANVRLPWSEPESTDIPRQQGAAEIQEDGRATEEYETEGRTIRNGQAEDDGEDIEEIDLTTGSFQNKYLERNEGNSYFPQSRVVFLPSMGVLGPTPLGAVMGDYFAGVPSLDIGLDAANDAVENESVDFGEVTDDKSTGSAEEVLPVPGQEDLVALFASLKTQHDQQMEAQKKQHRKQLAWLKEQILGPTPQGRIDSEEIPLLAQEEEEESQTSTQVSGSLGDTQMTTWSDVHDQRHGQDREMDGSNPQSGPTNAELAMLQQMQQNFELQQAVMQQEYQTQVDELQQEWLAMQRQQAQQRQHVAGMLQQQEAKIQQAAQPEIDPEETSSIFSDFTYWRLEEGDTYKDLPHSQPRGGQQSLTSNSLLNNEHQEKVSTHQAEMESSTHRDHFSTQYRKGLTKDSVISYEAHAQVFHPPAYMESPSYSDPHSQQSESQQPLTRDSVVNTEHVTPPAEMDLATIIGGTPSHLERGRTRHVDSPKTSSSRIALQEKYSRHIADLEAFYEGELQELRRQLAQARLASSVTREGGGASSITREGEGGAANSDRLYQHCRQLQTNLSAANSRIQDLESTVKALEARLVEWPDRYSLAHGTIQLLQQRAEDLMVLVRRREEDVRKVEKENSKLHQALLQARQDEETQAAEGKKEQAMLSKLIAQYTMLTEQHESTQAELLKVQLNLGDANSAIADLKRTAVRQELEIKQVEGEKRRLVEGRDPLTGHLTLGPFSPEQPRMTSPALHTGLNGGVSSPREARQDVLEDIVPRSVSSPREARQDVLGDIVSRSTPKAKSPSTPGSSLRLSVEDRKFLRSADFNIFTGEDSSPTSPAVNISNSPIQAPEVISPIQDGQTTQDTLRMPFDADLDARPLSPMMKAAAQLNRWQTSNKSSYRSPDLNASYQRTTQNVDRLVIPERDLSTDSPGESGVRSVSHKKRTRPSSAGSGKSGSRKERSKNSKQGVDLSLPTLRGESIPTKEIRKSEKTTSYKKAPTMAEHLYPGKVDDSSLHVWAVHQSPDTAHSGMSKNSKTSPRTGTSASALISPSRAARKDLATYSVREGRGSEKKKKSSPRRNLASSFQASGRKGVDGSTFGLGDLMSSKAVQTPTSADDYLEAALQTIREGHAITRADWENGLKEAPTRTDRSTTRVSSKTPESPEAILERLSKESRKLDNLMLEKRKLETALTRLPSSGPTSAKKLEEQERLEERLDQVTRELGSVRMLLRKYNALNMSF